jgi:polysaccharide pyruvyl transferase WcaK-like protein
VIGTGVASPDFWGVTEPVEGWLRWLSSCVYVGVRGPHSEATLRHWGYEGTLEVCGDPALLFERPEVEPAPGRVVISPAWTNGELWGGSDEDVMRGLAQAVAAWRADGRDIRFLSCNPADDRPIFEMMRAVGAADLPYLAGYRDLEGALRFLAEAELVVGERLHAAVLAAAMATPFVAVEYRPKLADFAASVGASDAVVRTDAVSPEALSHAAERAIDLAGTVAGHVAHYRSRLRAGAETIRQAVAE